MITVTEPQPSAPTRPLPIRMHRSVAPRAVAVSCQLCGASGATPVADLGPAPLLRGIGERADAADHARHELRLVRCTRCEALQLDDVLGGADRERIATAVEERPFAGRPDLARRFCEEAIDRWNLRGEGHIVEIGSGTGSLLRFFRAWQLPVLGLEPDPRLARYARLRRIPTWRATCDAAIAGRIARADMHADLVIVSTPTGAFDDLREIFAGAATMLRPGGVLTLEIPDVLRVIGRTRLDDLGHADRVVATIGQLQQAVRAFGLEVVDVERADVTDDRLRVWLRTNRRAVTTTVHPRVRTRLRAEEAAAVERTDTIAGFATRLRMVREQITELLRDARRAGQIVAVHGASPAAVTLANIGGLARPDVAYAVDGDAVRCGAALPGTDVPVITLEQAASWRPDLVLALDDLTEAPAGWEGVPVYAVSDLIDVVHRLTA